MCLGHLIIKCKCNWFCPRSSWEISQGRKCSSIPVGSIQKITSRITAENKISISKLKTRAGWHSCESVRALTSLQLLAWVRIPEATPYWVCYAVKPRLRTTSVIRSPRSLWRPLFLAAWQKGHTQFLVKKSLVNTANFFGPIGDRINGAPLYLLSSFSPSFLGQNG